MRRQIFRQTFGYEKDIRAMKASQKSDKDVNDARRGLALLRLDRPNFFRRYVTINKIRIYFLLPESNRDSAELLKASSEQRFSSRPEG